jgi:hypothetical protein
MVCKPGSFSVWGNLREQHGTRSNPIGQSRAHSAVLHFPATPIDQTPLKDFAFTTGLARVQHAQAKSLETSIVEDSNSPACLLFNLSKMIV